MNAAWRAAPVTPLKLNALDSSAFWWFAVLMCICGTSSTTSGFSSFVGAGALA
jgi:hypothetical protein